MLAANTILQNRYRIVRLLGQGGMGAVYEAIDQRVSCLVALKETLMGATNEARQAFEREAALLANMRHPALPKVMDYFAEGEGAFLVMEFIPGNDLAELLALRDGPFPQEQVVRWAVEILKLLEYLHTRDPPILHRDIKPANLKVTRQGEVFLLDFGLAKGAAGQMATVDTSKSVPGYTPVYAPLEQILGQGTDPRSDVYSLGATLYHLLTGQAPVSAPARFDAVENDRPDPLKPANQLNLQIASEIAACIQSAMALSRKDRPSRASEMRSALENAARVVADRDSARRAEADLIETLPGIPEDDPARPLVADKDVQFTVYAPRKIKPEKTYSLLAFAHLSKRRDDADEDDPDPIEEIKEQAARILGSQHDDYRDVKDASSQPVPRGGELTFVPVVQGLTFGPSSRSFTWRKSVHREEFDMWASPEVDGRTLKGRMTVFLGSIIIAEVELTISVDSRATAAAEKISLDQAQSARRVRQVFASYSHSDEGVVAELAKVAPIFGSEFVMDRTHLKPGENRIEGLQRLIRGADMFQVFWSTNSMQSAETVNEIKYAASLGRSDFILPTYWEEPLPRDPAQGLPPPEIERLHFHRIYPGAISKATLGDTAETRLVILAPAGAEVFVDDERHGSLGSSGRLILKTLPVGQHVVRITRAGQEDDERLVEIHAGAGDQVIQAQFKPVPTGALAMPGDVNESLAANSNPDISQEESRVTAPLEMPREDAATGNLPPLLDTIPAPLPAVAAHDVVGRPPVGDVVCPGCGTHHPTGVKFCGRCGINMFQDDNMGVPRIAASAPPLPVSPPPQAYAPVAPARRRKGLMMPIFAGAAMVLLVVIVAPVWFMMNQTGSRRNATVMPAATPNAVPRLDSNQSANSNTTASADPDAGSIPFSQFTRLEGGTQQLKDRHGRVVLLNFWATWCVPCRSQIPALNETQKTFEARGLNVVGISYSDTAAAVRQFQKEIPQDYQIGFVGNEMGAMFPSLPVTYILDHRGRVRKKMLGQQTRAALEAAIEPLLMEGP